MINKYDRIAIWLKGYTPLSTNWIYFNVTPVDAGSVSLNSVQNQRTSAVFNNGDAEVELVFVINLITYFDSGTSDINMEAMEEFENISDWIEKQNNAESFPDFGTDVISNIEVLETNPGVSVDTDENLAKYQGQYRISYLHIKEVN